MKIQSNEIELLKLSVHSMDLSGIVDNDYLRNYVLSCSKDHMYYDPNEIQIDLDKISDLLKVVKQIFVSIDSRFKEQNLYAWGHVIKPKTMAEPHIHTNILDPAALSWIYYVDVPEETGALTFTPNFFDNRIMIQPKASEMILLNGSYPHYVQYNMSEKERVSIAGNFIVTREMMSVPSKQLIKYMNNCYFNRDRKYEIR